MEPRHANWAETGIICPILKQRGCLNFEAASVPLMHLNLSLVPWPNDSRKDNFTGFAIGSDSGPVIASTIAEVKD